MNYLISTFWKVRIQSVFIAVFGVFAFKLIGLPLPFLFGPMAALLLAAVAGVQLRGATFVSDTSRAILGVAIGAAITPALVHQLPAMGLSMGIMPLFILIAGVIGVPYFKKTCGFDTTTAYYCAMPGGLQDMVLFGKEAGGKPRTISLVQATRLLAFVTITPFLLTHLYGASLYNPVGVPAKELPPSELLTMGILALSGWFLGLRIKLFGAPMMGPMILATFASLTGLLNVRPPAEAILFAQFFIGLNIGAHYSGITLEEIRKDVLSGLGFVVILGLICAAFINFISYFKLGDPVSVFLAYAPAGQSEMAVFAIVVGADLGFVVAHHLVRIVLVIIGAPLAAAWINSMEKTTKFQ